MSAPRILAGATYHHRPSGRLVVVVDHECRARRRSPLTSARTGRLIVRDPADASTPPFLASETELE